MKKIITFFAILCITLSTSAKTWDFTNWSKATLDMIKAIAATTADDKAEWRTVEKSGGCGDGVEGCYFKVGAQTYAPMTVNGAEIPELKGLKFTCKATSASFGLIWNMQTTTDGNQWGPYHGPAYVWSQTGGDTITVPGVKRNTKLKIGVESHKPSEARGYTLYVDGATVAADEEASVTTKAYAEVSWTIPAGDGAKVEAKLVPNKGCHIYSITIESEETQAPLAYLYNTTPTQTLKDRVAALETYKMTDFDLATMELSSRALEDFDVVVIDPAVGADKAKVLKSIIPWQPVVNFCADLYDVWGYGTKATPSSELAVIKKDNPVLFSNIEITEGEGVKMFSVTNGEAMPVGLTLAGNFADDDVYAVDFKEPGDETPSAVLFHSHNANHNAYYYMPYGVAAVADVPEGTEPVFANVIQAAANSKSKVGSTPTPEINVVNGKLDATITIIDKVAKSAIYYTTDGTDPTEASTLYNEPFVVTTDCTIKAIALGEGYTLSEIASAVAVMKDQAKTPVIAIGKQAEPNTPIEITITTDEVSKIAGDSILVWYNYTGETDTLKSTRYTEPVKVQTADNKTIYAFAVSANLVASVVAEETFSVNAGANLRRNLLTRMDANEEDWSKHVAFVKSPYYFSWGKSAVSMYNEIEDPENPGSFIKVLKTPETQRPGNPDSIPGSMVYENEYNADWQIKSYGQVMNWQKVSYGMSLNDGSGYNPWKVDDLDTEDLLSKLALQFGGKADGESANASIETVKKFKGPFNFLAFIGNGSADKSAADPKRVYRPAQTLEIAVSTDTTNIDGWVVLENILTPTNQRNWSKYEIPYNGTDEVFVRLKQVAGGSSAYVFNICLMGPSGSSVLLGDANADGTIDVADITAIASHILGKTPELWNATNADANQDKTIDVADITATAELILGKN